MNTILVYTLLAIVGVVGAAGDAALNQWARSNRIGWLMAAYAIWIGVATLFGIVLKLDRFTFGTAVVLALLVHSIVAIVFDQMYFGSRLTGWERAGLACALVAICLIEAGRAAHTSGTAPAEAAIHRDRNNP